MLTVATWNLENLFRPGVDGGPSSQATYEHKLDALAATIERLAPDVLAVQEVGSAAALGDLVGRLSGAWHTELSPDPDGRGIRVGFLSRLALSAVERIRALPDGTDHVRLEDDGKSTAQMGRGALKVRIDVAGTKVELVTAHLKSKLLRFAGAFQPRDEGQRARYAGYALALRTAEAITLRHHATRLLDGTGDRALIVLGDFNDEPLAATTQMLLGPPGSELKTGGFDRPDRGDGQRLWNIAPHLPTGRDVSRVFNGRGELIDHILVSHALARSLDSADVGMADLPSVSTEPDARRDEPGSDHAPVVARFRLA